VRAAAQALCMPTPSPSSGIAAGIEASLRRSLVPTRIVWGTGDTIFSAKSPGYLDRVFANSRGVRLVEGAKLFFPEEYPDLIAQEARALWGLAR
jgi:pimeloyl-ACP methyl ester carboxylesterase